MTPTLTDESASEPRLTADCIDAGIQNPDAGGTAMKAGLVSARLRFKRDENAISPCDEPL
ncbi:hypothetical protein PSQ20_19865 [Curvibacter sp. RS43]|uniref:hypothetical protein n=1 Tax=Curvibacter microcysteis TaxID=3026419 RepID=UPI00236074A2|nr:hypothetical protein [Curvibacter sp. RS43]MDD0812614.1 hypothetical protein [Curvibacter sp. RS43]